MKQFLEAAFSAFTTVMESQQMYGTSSVFQRRIKITLFEGLYLCSGCSNDVFYAKVLYDFLSLEFLRMYSFG